VAARVHRSPKPGSESRRWQRGCIEAPNPGVSLDGGSEGASKPQTWEWARLQWILQCRSNNEPFLQRSFCCYGNGTTCAH